MNCPCCNKPMIVVEIDQIEIDHCVHCKGAWLDGGELELLLDDAANSKELVARVVDSASVNETSRRCPICNKKMKKITFLDEAGKSIILDSCVKNDGLWFDQGELSEVLKNGDFPPQHEIYEILNEIFGENR